MLRETLKGFKWLGNISKDLEAEGLEVGTTSSMSSMSATSFVMSSATLATTSSAVSFKGGGARRLVLTGVTSLAAWPYPEVVFAFEEAIGFMFGAVHKDKAGGLLRTSTRPTLNLRTESVRA